MNIIEIDTNKIILSGNNASGKTELGVEMAYGSLKLGSRITYITNEENLEKVKTKFLFKDTLSGLNLVDFSQINIIKKEDLIGKDIEVFSNIYIFDGVTTLEFESMLDKIKDYEESNGRDLSDKGILFITTKVENNLMSRDRVSRGVKNLFTHYYTIVSSTKIEDTEELATYMMRLNILELTTISALDDEVVIKIKQ